MQQQSEFAANSNIGDGVIDPNAVAAQTAANTDIEGTATAHAFESAMSDDEPQQENIKLGYGEEIITQRIGNNKKWRDPAKEKRRKQIAAASRKRNRRA